MFPLQPHPCACGVQLDRIRFFLLFRQTANENSYYRARTELGRSSSIGGVKHVHTTMRYQQLIMLKKNAGAETESKRSPIVAFFVTGLITLKTPIIRLRRSVEAYAAAISCKILYQMRAVGHIIFVCVCVCMRFTPTCGAASYADLPAHTFGR